MKVVNGILELTDKDLLSLGLDDKYFDAILESHEQLMSSLRRDDQSKEGARGPDTRGALKHPAWDRLSDTSSEGWMEFFKSLRCNAMTFGIALTPFEAFDMVYRDKGHGLCLCSLSIRHYRAMGWALFSVLQ
jgi:hypothetical protein